MKNIYWIAIFGILLYMNGCQNYKNLSTKIEKVANAELAIIKAQDSKAYELAPQELLKAQKKLKQAKRALKNKSYDQAGYLAEQALVDAALAEAQAELTMCNNISKEKVTTSSIPSSVKKGESNVNFPP